MEHLVLKPWNAAWSATGLEQFQVKVQELQPSALYTYSYIYINYIYVVITAT